MNQNERSTTQEVAEVKENLTELRLKIKEEKSKVDKLGEITFPIAPEDFEVMYAGKLCLQLIKTKTTSDLIIQAYTRDYPELDETVRANLMAEHAEFIEDFETAKSRLEKVIKKHPLWKRMEGIKGFSAYQLGLIMASIKNIERFDTPSKLCVYAGVASINELGVTKANLNSIKEYRIEQFGKEFKGFNTKLSGRMFVIADSLIRAKGYFYNFNQRVRERIKESAISRGKCEKIYISDADRKKLDKFGEEGDTAPKYNVDEKGAWRWYMKGRKNQTLDMWSLSNVKKRIGRTILHLLYTEWRKLRNLPVRNPYVIDYLKHSGWITIEEIIKADSVKAERKPRKKEEIVKAETKTGKKKKAEQSKKNK